MVTDKPAIVTVSGQPVIVDPPMTADDWRSIRHWLEPRIFSPEDDDEDEYEDECHIDYGGEAG